MQRLFVVYNQRSSNYVRVQSEFLSKLPTLKSHIIGKYDVSQSQDFDENVKKLAKCLKNGDTLISAGGDATASIAVNAILKSGKSVTLGVLPYGNFNDLARTLGMMTADEIMRKTILATFYPLIITIDGELWRYASCYVTIGMTAESVAIFDNPKIRKKMQQGHKSSWRSYFQLASWYFKNRHKKVFIPDFKINGKTQPHKTSDYAAVNGKSMSRVMKGGDDYLSPTTFRSETEKTASFPRLFILMAKSILIRTPGHDTTGDTLTFDTPATITLQCEGESRTFKNVKKIEIRKDPKKCLQVIHKN